MKGKRGAHYAGPQGSKVTNMVQRMLRGGGTSSAQTHGTHMPADEPIGRALKAGRSPSGKSSGGKRRR